MEKRLKASLGQHHGRMNRELSRAYLRAIFEFLERGIPVKELLHEPPDRVMEVQAAIRDILESTFDGKIPRKNSMRVFRECLNQPRKAVCKPYGRFIEAAGTNQWKERRKVTSWSFPGSPFRSLAELLLRCLCEFHRVIFVPELYRAALVHGPLLGRCHQCSQLFLKGRSNEGSCSRTCSKSFDYRKRISQKPDYYKKKSKANAAAKKAQEEAWSRSKKPAS